MQGLAARIIASTTITALNRLAPIGSFSLLLIYAFRGISVNIIPREHLPPTQKNCLDRFQKI